MPRDQGPADFVEFTHKGWFGLCPVIVGDPDGQCYVDVRWDWMNFWLDLQMALFSVAVTCRQSVDPAWQPEGWLIRLTGRLKRPVRKPVLADQN